MITALVDTYCASVRGDRVSTGTVVYIIQTGAALTISGI